MMMTVKLVFSVRVGISSYFLKSFSFKGSLGSFIYPFI